MVFGNKLESACYLDVQGFLPEVNLYTNETHMSIIYFLYYIYSSDELSRLVNILFYFFRFCSRPFTLASGHESIHLCNNAVQTKYANAERSSKLPPDNMWDNKVIFTT